MVNGGALTVRTNSHAFGVIVTATDTGRGMLAEERLHGFEPFFTTKAVKGSGCGLSSALGIVERHGGSMEVASEKGCGTTFAVKLPISGNNSDRGSTDNRQLVSAECGEISAN